MAVLFFRVDFFVLRAILFFRVIFFLLKDDFTFYRFIFFFFNGQVHYESRLNIAIFAPVAA